MDISTHSSLGKEVIHQVFLTLEIILIVFEISFSKEISKINFLYNSYKPKSFILLMLSRNISLFIKRYDDNTTNLLVFNSKLSKFLYNFFSKLSKMFFSKLVIEYMYSLSKQCNANWYAKLK